MIKWVLTPTVETFSFRLAQQSSYSCLCAHAD